MNNVKFFDYSQNVKGAMEQAAIAWLHEVAGEIKSQTQRNTRVDSSQLKNNWDYKVDKANFTALIGSPLENAICEEFGTGEHALGGKGRQTPWFVPVDGYTGKRRPTYNGKVVIVHGKNKKKYYMTNGKKPNRAFWDAYTKTKPKAEKRAKAIFKSELKYYDTRESKIYQ